MGLTNFPYGITSFGVPVMGGAGRVTTGSTFFVHSVTGSDIPSPYGDSPDKPFATVDYAIGKCTADKGDVIYVMPGHVETLASASAIDCDVSGISIIGIGNPTGPTTPVGYGAPIFDYTAAAATLELAADSVTIENITFRASIAAVASAISNTGASAARILNCRFYDGGTNLNFLVCYLAGSGTKSNYLEIAGCHAVCPDSDNLNFIACAGTPAGINIHHNVLMGSWQVGAIGGNTTPGTATGIVTNANFSDNIILNVDASSANTRTIKFGATATGVVARNMVGVGAATDVVTPGDLAAFENYVELHTTDLSGLLDPASA